MAMINRRYVLTSLGGVIAASALPARAWAATDAPGLDFVYEAIVTLEPTQEFGPTPLGTRRRIPITGGTFAGPRIRASYWRAARTGSCSAPTTGP